jgi:hypothetical protein
MYSMMSGGRTSGMPGSPAVPLSRRGSSPLRPGKSHLSPRKGSDLVMLLKSHGRGKVPRVHTDLESKVVLISICLFVPLLEGSTVKK